MQATEAPTDVQRAAEAARSLLRIPYCPHDPVNIPQQARYLLWFGLEALYGGAVAGGKSDALLMAALQFVDVPGYAALLVRRRQTDLRQPGALLDRADSWFAGTGARWRGRSHAWRFPEGSTIVFGYLDDEKDKYRYQSAEFQFIAFDELTQFSETQYRFLFTRLRRPKLRPEAGPEEHARLRLLSKVPLRMRAASNPGGIGHEWVRRRFQLHAPEDKRTLPPQRRFYRATMRDNPFVDEEEYRKALAELDPITRAQMESGSWLARPEGALLQRQWFDRILNRAPVSPHKVRYWDLAATEPKRGRDPDWTVGARCSRPNGRFTIEHITRFRKTPGEVEDAVKQQAQLDGTEVHIWIEQEPGSSGKSLISHYRRNVLPGFVVQAHPKRQNKVAAASPWASRAQAGEVDLVEGVWVDEFLDEAELFPTIGAHDDQIDAVSGAYAVLVGESGIARIRRPETRVPSV